MPDSPRLLVADSFRVRRNPKTGEAEVRGLQFHLDRFRRAAHHAWVGEHLPTAAEHAAYDAAMADHLAAHPNIPSTAALIFLPTRWTPHEQQALDTIDAFLRDACERIVGCGSGWPRLELWHDSPADPPRLALQLRPLPPLGETIELRTVGHLAVEYPEVKGPNIDRYAALNRELGAEALLMDARGYVLEGTSTSLVWWPCAAESSADTSAECITPDLGRGSYGSIAESRARVSSITERLLVMAGGRRLVGTKPNRKRIGQPQPHAVTPAQLMRHEVWAVNALHGIRVVTSIDGALLPAPDERRLRWFRDALDRTWEPVR